MQMYLNMCLMKNIIQNPKNNYLLNVIKNTVNIKK